ncbi:MAG TPA: response regulator [Kofleriaceae bacterium]
MGRVDRQPAKKDLLRLIVDYENADEFLQDYAANLASSTAFIAATRTIALATIIEIGFSFPGLMQPIALDAVVTQVSAEGLTIAFLEGGAAKLKACVERIRARDPKLIAPVVNVLIVEDNKHVCDLVRQGLAGSTRREMRDITFTFATAENGAIALELLRTRTFDAAIVDVYLPVLDGASLIQQARTQLGLTKLPIITMSAGGDGARAAALKAGASVFLDKPVRLREVVATMRQLLSV